MGRFFNVAGPCVPGQHYMLPPQERCPEVHPLIEQGLYFVIHSARQTGKTTLLRALSREMNSQDRFHALYCSFESLQGIIRPEDGIPAAIRTLRAAIHDSSKLNRHPFASDADYSDFNNVLRTSLSAFCRLLDRPLVLLFDEADCMSNGTLVQFLRQLREGYIRRDETPFAHSVALVGMRNIRDFKACVRDDGQTLGSASPFNVVTKALTLQSFDENDIATLFRQHTEAAGQVFEKAAVRRAAEQTGGQPWLVNAIARECVAELLQNDFTRPVTAGLVDQAIQNIVLRRDTHIDSLLERLKEDRVRAIIEPMLTGQEAAVQRSSDDYEYVRDLGLIRDDRGVVEPANPIYGEVIARTLSSDLQHALEAPIYPYALVKYRKGSGLDMGFLLKDFQQFWRENSAIWRERFEYKEAAPHLVLMAFLQRVLNGGGRIVREMAAEMRRLDLCVELDEVRYPIELKIRRSEKTEAEGVGQLCRYMDSLGCREGWLVIFDRDSSRSWDEKIFWKTETMADGKTLHLVGC
ncbi:MAG: ATP-binding protein [Verrucomicrobia bacterium]|nr:ATP-binding protein [Verrucomicrobiota bacterium]